MANRESRFNQRGIMKQQYDRAVELLGITKTSRELVNIRSKQWAYMYLFDRYKSLHKTEEQCMVIIAEYAKVDRVTVRHHIGKFYNLYDTEIEYKKGYLHFKSVMDKKGNHIESFNLLNLKLQSNLRSMQYYTSRMNEIMNKNQLLVDKIVNALNQNEDETIS